MGGRVGKWKVRQGRGTLGFVFDGQVERVGRGGEGGCGDGGRGVCRGVKPSHSLDFGRETICTGAAGCMIGGA
jgi:hypothetical protein